MNTEFVYFYRDGSNYKSPYQHWVFSGDITEDQTRRLMSALPKDNCFVAEQVDVPTCYIFEDGRHEYAPDEDHGWHEFHSVGLTRELADDVRTIEEFIKCFETVNLQGWKPLDHALET